MRYPIDYRIIFNNSDTGIANITIPAGWSSIETVRSKARDVFGSVEMTEMGIDDFNVMIINDRKLRNAWIVNTNGIREDVDRSKDVMRWYRNVGLNLLDVYYQAEQRKPNGDLTTIDAKANILRNVPNREEFNGLNILAFKNIIDEIFVIRKWAQDKINGGF